MVSGWFVVFFVDESYGEIAYVCGFYHKLLQAVWISGHFDAKNPIKISFRRPSFSAARLTICANVMSIHALLPQGRWRTIDLFGGQHG